jgi:hypothetical protein
MKRDANGYRILPDIDKRSTRQKLSKNMIFARGQPMQLSRIEAAAIGTHVPGPFKMIWRERGREREEGRVQEFKSSRVQEREAERDGKSVCQSVCQGERVQE